MTSPSGLNARLSARVGQLSLELELETGLGTLVVVGPNGAGKTSLLSLLLGVRPCSSGRIEVGGTLLFDSRERVDLPTEQRRLGYVPQQYALFPHLTVRQNIDFALHSPLPKLPREQRAARVTTALGELGLTELAERWPASLSGGEKQRVALARALSVQPRALLLDEPLGALDAHARREVRRFLAGYLRELALPTLIVTHDPADARMLGSRIAVLENGRVTQSGSFDELAAAPATPFVQTFVTLAAAEA